MSALLLLNSENIILFKIDRVVNPDGVRILCKYLGKLFFVIMQQWQIKNQNNPIFSFYLLIQISLKIDQRASKLIMSLKDEVAAGKFKAS